MKVKEKFNKIFKKAYLKVINILENNFKRL